MPTEITLVAADKMAAKLNSTTFSQSFTATRMYLVEELYDLETDDTLHVACVPSARQDSFAGRCIVDRSLVVDIGIVKKLPDVRQQTVDVYMELMGEILEFFEKPANRMLGDNYTVLEVVADPIYSTEHLRDMNTYLAVVRARITAPKKVTN